MKTLEAPFSPERNGHARLIDEPPGGEDGRAYVDRIPRRRDANGDRLPAPLTYDWPYPEERPVMETALRPALDRIAAARPARAAWLVHYYDHCLLPALDRSRRARREAERELEVQNDRAREENAALDREQEDLRAAAEDAARPRQEQAVALELELAEAHLRAGERFAAVDRVYDPRNPSEEALLAVPQRDLAFFAAQERLPDPRHDERLLLPGWLIWLCTGLVGTAVGLSLGLLGSFIAPDTIGRQLGQVAGFMVLGFALAAFGRKAVVLAHRQAAERGYLGLAWRRRWAFLLGALAFDAALLLIDLWVEREGILKLARLSGRIELLSGAPAAPGPAPFVWYAAPLVVTLGYVAYSAWEGYLAGRRDPVLNRLHRLQQEAYESDRAVHRCRSDVGAALAALLAVRELQRRLAEARQQSAAAAAPFLERIAALERRRLPHLPDFTAEQRARIQDSHDNLLGADLEFRRALAAEMDLVEPYR